MKAMKIYEASLTYNCVGTSDSDCLDSPKKIVSYLEGVFDEDPTVEYFIAIPFNRKNRPLARIIVSKGTASSCLVHPREVFKPAILASACAIAVAHNHPSGDPAPSRADFKVTSQLREAAKIIGIDLLDHVIIGSKEDDPQGLGHYSFNEAGLV